MQEPKVGDFDTPRTNIEDAIDLSSFKYDFDISQDLSFQPPQKINQRSTLVPSEDRNIRRPIKTPKSRTDIMDRNNFPLSGGGEFTPLLKNATRNSLLKSRRDKVAQTQTPTFAKPGGLSNIPEDLSPIPTSTPAYADSANGTYLANITLPLAENTSVYSSPMDLQLRRNGDTKFLKDFKQLSLREQEVLMDQVQRDNFGLKLKVHFLEEALNSKGKGYSEEVVKENAELKVDQITMKKELLQYRKTLNSAEKEVELYRQQLNDLQENMTFKDSHEEKHEKSGSRQQAVGHKKEGLDQRISNDQEIRGLRARISDLEVKLSDKTFALEDRENKIINLKEELEKYDFKLHESKVEAEKAQRRVVELEGKLPSSRDLEISKETNKRLEQNLKESDSRFEKLKQEQSVIYLEKCRAEADLEQMRDEIVKKTMGAKGLSNQLEQTVENLQSELKNLREECSTHEENLAQKTLEIQELENKFKKIHADNLNREQSQEETINMITKEKILVTQERDNLVARYKSCQESLQLLIEEKKLLQKGNETLTNETHCLQRDLDRSRITAKEAEEKLTKLESKTQNDLKNFNAKGNAEIERLDEELNEFRVKLQERENKNDADHNKWKIERRSLVCQIETLQDKVNHLQKTIDILKGAEGTLSSKEAQLRRSLESEITRNRDQETVLNRHVNELSADIQARQQENVDIISELTKYKEELRLCQMEKNILAEKIELLEDEVEVLQTNLDEETEEFNKEKKSAKLESDKLRQQIQLIKADLSNAESAAHDARTEIDKYQKIMKAGEGSKEQLQSRLIELEEQLIRAHQEKQSFQDELSRVRSELFTVKASSTDLENQIIDLNKKLTTLQRQGMSPTLDQEKNKLRSEVQHLRGEHQRTIASLQAALREEIENAGIEKSRLKNEIQSLQKIAKNSSDRCKLLAAADEIGAKDTRFQLENGATFSDNEDANQEDISIVRWNLKAAREKEVRYAQREATQKRHIRSLKKEIIELEERIHNAELLHFVSSSPNVHNGDSAQLDELSVMRAQLASVNQSLKESRAQLKNTEKEAYRNLTAANIAHQARIQAIELEKDEIEISLNKAQFDKDELEAKYTAAEATTARLRGKVERLEKALDAERQNSGEDRTMVLERKDLHEMLRESQAQVEALDIRAREQDNALAAMTTSQKELKIQIKHAYEERMHWHKQATAYQEQMEQVQRRFQDAQKSWMIERKNLTRGVRFTNVSPSLTSDSPLLALTSKYEAREHHHVKEMRGISLQLEWATAKCRREEFFRAEAAFAKRFMAMQIALFEACNKADIQLLESCGIQRPPPRPKKPVTIKRIGSMIRAIIRMKKGAELWAIKRKIDDKIKSQTERQRYLQQQGTALRPSKVSARKGKN